LQIFEIDVNKYEFEGLLNPKLRFLMCFSKKLNLKDILKYQRSRIFLNYDRIPTQTHAHSIIQ